jgi:hypothetical protein
LRQYVAREGHASVPRSHVEVLTPAPANSEQRTNDGTPVKLGVWIMNTKSRRAALSEEQRAELGALGLTLA